MVLRSPGHRALKSLDFWSYPLEANNYRYAGAALARKCPGASLDIGVLMDNPMRMVYSA